MTTNFPALTALSPLDGRYHSQTAALGKYFSEWALFKYRVEVEWLYLQALCDANLPGGPVMEPQLRQQLDLRFRAFGVQDAQRIKEIEQTTLHDIKAMEYWMKGCLEENGGAALKEWVHFGLTSQDINHTAVPMSLRDARQDLITPALDNLLDQLRKMAMAWLDLPMLARTHGQPASPTRLGKEFLVWVERLERQMKMLSDVPVGAKFGGATGNFNAHHLVWPQTDWPAFADHFVQETLGLTRYRYTTQIEHYDYLAAYCHNMIRIQVILLDLCRDLWQYISMGYFHQEIREGQVGSSAMPHKVNPIDFENAEGNLGLSNALLGHLAEKLPISRLQRDLSDSTVLRNLGVPLGHTILALQSLSKGLSKIKPDPQALAADLDQNWAVLAEGIQTLLRARGIETPYEKLKELTRTGQRLDRESLQQFIATLGLDPEDRDRLLNLSPDLYLGVVPPPHEPPLSR
jgi:adenylosuccinate lyase